MACDRADAINLRAGSVGHGREGKRTPHTGVADRAPRRAREEGSRTNESACQDSPRVASSGRVTSKRTGPRPTERPDQAAHTVAHRASCGRAICTRTGARLLGSSAAADLLPQAAVPLPPCRRGIMGLGSPAACHDLQSYTVAHLQQTIPCSGIEVSFNKSFIESSIVLKFVPHHLFC